MNKPYFIEVLGRGNEVRQRQRVDDLPIRIGRGYDNDFILDDRHTSAHHAIVDLDEEGNMEICDLDSRNGVIVKGRRQTRLNIDGDTVFRLGHTNLRVRSADFPVADEMKDTTRHGWEGWPPAVAGLALTALLSLAGVWQADTENAEAITYLTGLVGMLSLILLWSGGWTLANRLFGKQTRFGRHLFIAASGLVVAELASQLCAILAYALSLEFLSRYSSHITIAIAAGMVYFHLRTINPLRVKGYVVAAVLCSLTGSGLMLMFNYQSNGRLADEPYMSNLLPPALHLGSGQSVDEFLSAAGELKGMVDNERTKTVGLDSEGEDGGD